MKTFKILEVATIEDGNTGSKKTDADKENQYVNAVEKKSITEEDSPVITVEKEATTTEPDPLPSNEK